MILVDTSVIIAWLDSTHSFHKQCLGSILKWAGHEQLAISSVTYAELAAGARTREAVDEDLKEFERLDLDFVSAWRAGQAFRRSHPDNIKSPVLPDFFIRAQAATHSLRHLTNDRRRLAAWPEVDFLFPAK